MTDARSPKGRVWVAGLLAAGLLVGCESAPQTGFLVAFSTQLPLRRMVVRVFDSGGALAVCREMDLDAKDRAPLPATLGLQPASGVSEGRSVRVMALGYLDGSSGSCADANVEAADIRAEAKVTYVEGEVLDLPLPFTLSCLKVRCDGGDVCRHGRCVGVGVDASKLSRSTSGSVEGAACYRLEACGGATELRAPRTGTCIFDLPAAVRTDDLVPYVAYDLGGDVEPAAEFLSTEDYAPIENGAALELSPSLCALRDAGVVLAVGVATPCEPLGREPICRASLDEGARIVEAGRATGPEVDAGTTDAARPDGTVPDAGADGADGGVDGGADGTTPEGSTSDASTSDGSSTDASATDGSDGGGGASDAGGDASDAGGSGDASGGGGGRPTNQCLQGSDCCGLCINETSGPRCYETLGPSFGPTPLRSNVAMNGESIFWISGTADAPLVNRVVPGSSMIVESFAAEGPAPFGIVTVGRDVLVVGRLGTGGRARMDTYDLTQWRGAPPVPFDTGDDNYVPLLASDDASAFLVRRSSAGTTALNTVSRLVFSGPSIVTSVPATFTEVTSRVDFLAANGNAAALVVEGSGRVHLATVDFDGAVTIANDTTAGGPAFSSILGLGAATAGSRAFSFLGVDLPGIVSTLHIQRLGVAPMAAGFGSFPVTVVEAAVTNSVSDPGLVVIDETARTVANHVSATLDIYPLATTGANPSSLRVSGRCVAWEEDDGMGGRVVRAAPVAP
ncbi:MAG: hypothetical protein U0169_04990 [Polyangiaceae bacterium]